MWRFRSFCVGLSCFLLFLLLVSIFAACVFFVNSICASWLPQDSRHFWCPGLSCILFSFSLPGLLFIFSLLLGYHGIPFLDVVRVPELGMLSASSTLCCFVFFFLLGLLFGFLRSSFVSLLLGFLFCFLLGSFVWTLFACFCFFLVIKGNLVTIVNISSGLVCSKKHMWNLIAETHMGGNTLKVNK